MKKIKFALFQEQTKLWPLIILRTGLGFLWLKAGFPKLFLMLEPGKMATTLQGWLSDMPTHWYPWYQPILRVYIIPHANLFAYLVSFGEVAVGLGLIFGCMTRGVLLAGIFMNINYHLASGYKPGAFGLINLLFILAQLTLLFTTSGRSMGIDSYLNKQYPRIPLW
jgi:thiosulfate dehydrogenase (quinone) large subunit